MPEDGKEPGGSAGWREWGALGVQAPRHLIRLHNLWQTRSFLPLPRVGSSPQGGPAGRALNSSHPAGPPRPQLSSQVRKAAPRQSPRER